MERAGHPIVRTSNRPAVRPARLRNAPSGRTVIAGLTRNLFHLPYSPLLSPELSRTLPVASKSL
ncbi:MAG: hypothetical protein LBD35_06185 [Prevotellaceae bacterium]|nr:hypothetical protein [Prevotellaceae bacterium]